jgi:hypothetical protein
MVGVKPTVQLTMLELEGFLGVVTTRGEYPSGVPQLKYIKDRYENSKMILIGDTLHDEATRGL